MNFTATDQEYANNGGGTFTADNDSFVLGFVGQEEDTTFRYEMQFNISGLPAGVTITQAQLRLADVDGSSGHSISLGGFDGNGTFPGTINSTTGLMSITPGNANADFYTVTTFVQGLPAGDEAGFSLINDALAPADQFSNTSASASVAPELQITFNVPEPGAAMLFGGSILILVGLRRRIRQPVK